MSRTPTLAVCAAMLVGSWAICAVIFSINGGGGYNEGFFGPLIAVAGVLTLGSVVTVVGAWRTEIRVEGRVLAATVLTVLASLSALVLALAINGRG